MNNQIDLLAPDTRHFLLWTASNTACGRQLTPFQTLILQLTPPSTPLCSDCADTITSAQQWAAANGYDQLSPADALLLRKKLIPADYFWKRRWGPTPDEDPDWVKANYLEFNQIYEETLDRQLYNLGRRPKRAHRIAWQVASDNSAERSMMQNGY